MKFVSILAATAGIMLSTQSHAGFYIEPGITYESSDSALDFGILGTSTGTTQGLGVNLKLGYHADDVFFVGPDVSYSKPKFTLSTTNYDAAAASTMYGFIIGGQMPVVGLRIWGGYIFGGELNPEASGGFDVNFKDPQGLKVGVGFKVVMVSVNVEYMDLEYQTSAIEAAGPFSGSIDNKLKNKVGLVSVSFPLTL